MKKVKRKTKYLVMSKSLSDWFKKYNDYGIFHYGLDPTHPLPNIQLNISLLL